MYHNELELMKQVLHTTVIMQAQQNNIEANYFFSCLLHPRKDYAGAVSFRFYYQNSTIMHRSLVAAQFIKARRMT